LPQSFPIFVARRYLKAKRKQAVIGVITVISILGVAAGVMALIIALAINNGFRNTLQRNLLGATAHVSILEEEPGLGIDGWRELREKLAALPHVVSAEPTLYAPVFLAGPLLSEGAIIKGIRPDVEVQPVDVLNRLTEGSLDRLSETEDRLPGIILGDTLARRTGMMLDSAVNVISPQGELTPFGPRPSYHRFRVCGIFDSGFYQLDSAWAFTSLEAAQKVLAVGDVVNSIELRLDDIYRAPEVAEAAREVIPDSLAPTTWMEQNRQLLSAMRMERVVTVITIGLIQLIAALNILITLVMMVMEKHRDIALLMSMGCRREQIRRIFMTQGVIIGAIGSSIGLVAGEVLCFLADHYRWIRLDAEIYSLNYVPFEPRWIDALWVPAAALLVSFLATIYPARAATRIAPAEALRYE
jgi:lipoprotein-releasing system permease protein